MKCVVNCILALVFLFSFPAAGHTRFHGAIQIFSLESQSIKNLSTEFRRLKELGINTVIFRCFKNPGDSSFALLHESKPSGVYFKSPDEPLVSNLLPLVLKAAKESDLICYAWITTRKCQWILKEHPEWEGSRFDPVTGKNVPSGQLDIFMQPVRQRLSNMLVDLAGTGVDGILLQDDFISRQYDDFETAIWTAFAGASFESSNFETLFQKVNSRFRYTSRYHKWASFKSRSLANSLTEMISQVKQQFPDTEIAINLYYETVSAPGNARSWLAQDLEELIKTPVDRWAIMAYQHQMMNELSITLQSATKILTSNSQKLVDGYLLAPDQIFWEIQIEDWNTGDLIPADELYQCIKGIDDFTFVVVPYRNGDSLKELEKAMRRIKSQ